MDYVRINAIVKGYVQGVGYRFFTERKAKEYGITGWVKNLRDGNVQVVAEGERSIIEEFIKDLKVGPHSASVTDIEIKWEKYTGEFKDFEVRF
jgi:acylphosphatase|uniref:acylphosphatase n=1 Tax=candidate division WOR-3 bacterium TaxID=2052148 RepID=A0A7C4YFQ5_UNCW3